MHHHRTGLGLGRKDTGWPTPHGRRAAGPRAWPSGWPVCTSYETHLRSSPPPPATRHCTQVSAGGTLLPRKLEGSPLARAGWTGHGIHADQGLLAPGLLFYEECPGLQSTQLCSREHQGACLWDWGLFRICLQTEISNAEEKPAHSQPLTQDSWSCARPPGTESLWAPVVVSMQCSHVT